VVQFQHSLQGAIHFMLELNNPEQNAHGGTTRCEGAPGAPAI
jgi:hypothetical protein